jgi:hypothetical protein
MRRLEDTPPTFDPLDEAYALASQPIDDKARRNGSAPPAAGASARADIFDLSPAPLPDIYRSSPYRMGGDYRGPPLSTPARLGDPARFTLRNLLLVITMASIVLAIGVRFPRPIFAGAAGVAALVTAVAASWMRGSGAAMQLAWWTLLGIYLMACGFAMAGM